jgi:predicted nucleotide-binding protein (sugar kinase/HSP70/actin superfamily)
MGIEPWSSTSTPASALRLGIEAAPESICLPFKAHLGHFIEADNAGCGHALMVNSLGTCRLTYYRGLIETILRGMGRKIRVWGLGFDGIKPPVIRYFDPPLIPFIKSTLLALEKIKVIDTIETAAWKTRPLEASRGDTTGAARACFEELERADTIRKAVLLRERVRDRFGRIRRKSAGRPPLRIGLIGEISLLRDRTLNGNAEIILGELGGEVRNFFLLGAELENIFGFGAGGQKAFARRELMKIAGPYLANPVGGHALDSVAHTIRCAGEGFDGMVHMCPAGCMPEVSVRPILAQVSREKDIPVLELSFDEHTSAVGVVTRLEAFVDILLARRERQGSRE